MRLLLDTHAFLWFVLGSPRLSRAASDAIEVAEDALLSAASGCEIAQKHARGRLPEADRLARNLKGAVLGANVGLLPITLDHAEAAGRLPRHHRDPFDRMPVAQALVDGLRLVSTDAAFDAYGVARIW